MDKDLKKVVKALKAQGFEVETTSKGHVAVYRDGELIATFSGTAGEALDAPQPGPAQAGPGSAGRRSGDQPVPGSTTIAPRHRPTIIPERSTIMEYNATIELPIRNLTTEQAGDLVDAFIDFHPAVSTSPLGWAEVTVTVHAESLAQAVKVATLAASKLDVLELVSVTAMRTTEYDRRPVAAERLPELLSVTEVAERLGVSRQAVLQRLERGSLSGAKVGTTWVVAASAADQAGERD